VILVSLTYILPFLAVYLTGMPASAFNEEGSWATVAGMLGGTIAGFHWLGFLVTLGGMMSAFGMFNALVLSYSRLPLAMARDGMLPPAFAKITKQNETPWVSIIACAICWLPCLMLGFQRLITLDILLYGTALILEFVTLVALRIREPKLKRGFRVPGGMAGAVTCGMFPFALLILAMVESDHESILGMNALLFGILIILAGVGVYFGSSKVRAKYAAQITPTATETA